MKPNIFRTKNHPYLDPKRDYRQFLGKKTFIEAVEEVCKKYGKKNSVGERTTVSPNDSSNQNDLLRYFTFEEVLKRSKSIGAGLLKTISTGELDEKFALFSTCNSLHLILTFACCFAKIPVVFIGPSSKSGEFLNILRDSNVNTVICGPKQLQVLKSIDFILLNQQCPNLRNIILLPGCPEEKLRSFYFFIELQEIEKAGEEILLLNHGILSEIPRKEEDNVIMIYSSGTTASQKGMLYTNRNCIVAFNMMTDVLSTTPKDVYLSFIPTTHIYGLCCVMGSFFNGAEVVFGSPFTLKEDIPIIRPTIFLSVPLVFEMFKKAIIGKMKSCGKWEEFEKILRRRVEKIMKGDEDEDEELEIFSFVRNLFGGRLRYALSAAAALSPDTHLFYRATLGKNKFIQAYGASEISGPGAFQTLDINRPGSVGYVMQPVLSCKIIDIPEMDNCGELCFKGDAIISGYFQRDSFTQEVFTNDGWYKTGDVVRVHKDGTISIIDRKKNIIKLNNGKYISLVGLELVYETSKFIRASGMCIFANSSKSFVVAIICADIANCKIWWEESRFKTKKFDLEQPELIDAVLKDLFEIHQKNGLKGPKNGTATGSKKKKRRNIYALYEPSIEKMFRGDGSSRIFDSYFK